MPEELSEEIDSFLKHEREKPPRNVYKEIARKQLDALGYGKIPRRLTEFLRDEGIASKIERVIPGTGNDKVREYINQLAQEMERIPNYEEAMQLLVTAFSGEPSGKNEDGTAIVTSFGVAQPSLVTVQTKFTMLRDEKDNLLYIANVKGTDKLVANLIVGSGFAEEIEVSGTIGKLKKDGKILLPHRSNKSLKMEVERPKGFEERSPSRTSYSHHVRTIYKAV